MTEAIEALNYLDIEPISTEDYVAYIQFIDMAQQKVDAMEHQMDYVKDLYDVMEEFKIPVPSEDMANYTVHTIVFNFNNKSITKTSSILRD